MYRENERQWSTYNFEVADTAMLTQHFVDYEQECRRCLEPRCRWRRTTTCSSARTPSTCSTRGAPSPSTDRVAYIARVRDLARLVSRAYVKSVTPDEPEAVEAA